MSISRDVIRQCLISKQREVDEVVIVNRPIEFEEDGNYVIVDVRYAGKSYLLYQRVRQLQAEGKGWDEILLVDSEDERLAEFQTEDFNNLLEAHLELYDKKPVVFLGEVQNIPYRDKFVRRLADAKYRVYATGSNAKMLSKEVATTSGGRFFICDAYPYSFKEYLAAQQVELRKHWEYDTIQRSEVKRHLNEYFYYGGLPEILLFENRRAALSNSYQKIYLGDICARNNIKNDRVLNILIKKTAESVRQPLSYNRLRNVIVVTGLLISVPTTIDYVDYAADSWLILPMENEIGRLTEKEMQKRYYFVDNGLLDLFLMSSETSLLEDMVAVELYRRYSKKNVFFLNAEKEIDFVVPDEKLAIQVSYSIKNEITYNREVLPLVKYAKTHEDWKCLLITYDEEGAKEEIPVVPVWKWLIRVLGSTNLITWREYIQDMDTKKLIEEVLLDFGSNKSLTDVSSKIQIIVRLLGDEKLKSWYTCEFITGYNDHELPKYRISSAVETKANYIVPQGFGAWTFSGRNVPVANLGLEKYKEIMIVRFYDTISAIIEFSKHPEDSRMSLSPYKQVLAQKVLGEAHIQNVHKVLSPSTYQTIIDNVQGRIINMFMSLNERVFSGGSDLKSNSAKKEIHQVMTNNITAGIVQAGPGIIEANNATITARTEQLPLSDVIAKLNSLADEIERVAKDVDEEFNGISRELIDIRTELSKPQPNSSFLKKSFKALTWGATVSCKTTIEELVKKAIKYLS